MYEKIARHIGHNIEVAYYGNLNAEYLNQPSEIVNVAVECVDCHEVIVDAENPEWAWEDKPVHHSNINFPTSHNNYGVKDHRPSAKDYPVENGETK